MPTTAAPGTLLREDGARPQTGAPEAVHAPGSLALSEKFRLDDGVEVRARIERVDSIVRISFLDGESGLLPGSPVQLVEDLHEHVGGITVTAHRAPASAVPITEGEAHDGLFRVIVATGCRSVKFFQYARHSRALDTTAGRLVSDTRWRLDAGSPYRGCFLSRPAHCGGMFDGPGVSASLDPFSLLRPAGGGAGDTSLPGRSTLTLRHDFETLAWCDGVLLGCVAWGYVLTWTLEDGRASRPAVSAGPTSWRPASPEPPPTRFQPVWRVRV